MKTAATLHCLCILLSVVLTAVIKSPPNSTRILSRQKRIVGGYEASLGDIPYQVLIKIRKSDGTHQCGGSLIAEDYVLTAAHCLKGTSAPNIEVLAGNVNKESSNWARFGVMRFCIHEEYKRDVYPQNDIAVIELDKRIPENDPNIRAIVMRESSLPGDTSCVVSGWGLTDGKCNDCLSDVLLYVRLPTVDTEDCSEQLGHNLDDRVICAGHESGGRGSCQGDSGGPLNCEGYLTGIVSWAYGCAEENSPTVYSSVSYYKPWIERTMEESNLQPVVVQPQPAFQSRLIVQPEPQYTNPYPKWYLVYDTRYNVYYRIQVPDTQSYSYREEPQHVYVVRYSDNDNNVYGCYWC